MCTISQTNEFEVFKKFVQELLVWVDAEVGYSILWVHIQEVRLPSRDMRGLWVVPLEMYVPVCNKLLNSLANNRHIDCKDSNPVWKIAFAEFALATQFLEEILKKIFSVQ